MTETFPIPPADLRFLVSGANLRDNPDLFLPAGKRAFGIIAEAAVLAGKDINAIDSVLDWGCGCGRVIRHFAGLPGLTKIAGCDINADLIKWCQENLPFGEFYQSGLMPKLKYADNSFELIYGCSVITHLGLDAQVEWMRELWRVLKPGGIAILTYHGEHYIAKNIRRIQDPREFGGGLFGDLNDGAEGSNEYGSIETVEALRSIFQPFELVKFLPRHHLMGKQDTAIFRKTRPTPIIRLSNLKKAAGEPYEIEVDLAGQSKLVLYYRSSAEASGAHLTISVNGIERSEIANFDRTAFHGVTLSLGEPITGPVNLKAVCSADGAFLYGSFY